LEARGLKPKLPLKLLERIDTPEKLKAYLDSLLISDVRKTGIDNRYELNIAITAIERFIVGHVGDVYPFPGGLKQALFDYQDGYWQDPKSGFFGAWYRLPNGEIRKTADISITFHVVSYRRDSIGRIPELIRTTLAFRDQEYPFGWLEEGVESNHHNYDVVRLFRLGWPRMDEAQREEARGAMRRMLDFCLKETMNPDGSFKLMDEDTIGSSFYFPITLLDELGYFRPRLRFWTSENFPGNMEVADRVRQKVESMGLRDTESMKVVRRLEEVQRDHRRRRIAVVLASLVGLWIVLLSARRWRRAWAR
jgi:hypothetical protein